MRMERRFFTADVLGYGRVKGPTHPLRVSFLFKLRRASATFSSYSLRSRRLLLLCVHNYGLLVLQFFVSQQKKKRGLSAALIKRKDKDCLREYERSKANIYFLVTSLLTFFAVCFVGMIVFFCCSGLSTGG